MGKRNVRVAIGLKRLVFRIWGSGFGVKGLRFGI